MTLSFLEKQLGYQLRRASSAMIADLTDSLAELDLTVAGMSVLMCIGNDVDRTQSDIGRSLNIQRANMAPLAGALAAQGLIARVAKDGRSHALVLTPAGKAALAEARQRVVRHEARFLPQLGAAERRQLIELLAAIWK